MNFLKDNLLTILIFLPVAGVVLILLADNILAGSDKSKSEETQKRIAFGMALLGFVLSLGLLIGSDYSKAGLLFERNFQWITAYGLNARYHIGVDGLSVWLVILTTLLFPISILGSWHSVHKRVREFLIFLLLLEAGVIGVFVSFDLFLFYLFWEVMLIPMYFLIGVWGGERRIYAAVKFVLYTMVGSLLMLAGIIALYYLNSSATGVATFDIVEITRNIREGTLSFDPTVGRYLFAAFALAFFIKVPVFPFHTWLPDAHVEAPTAGSVILAGVLLKMGTYSLIRFNLSMFPAASREFAPYIEVLAVIGIIYGALVAMVQPDMKKLIAYSSVSHMGFIILGMFAFTEQGLQGSVYQMLNHGVSTGALFLLVGVIYDRRHTRLIADFGGLATRMPVFAAVFLWITFSSIGLPLLNGFVGEFMTLLGTFTSTYIHAPTLIDVSSLGGGPFDIVFKIIYAVGNLFVRIVEFIATPYRLGFLATTGIIWSACYMLWMYQRVFLGENRNPDNQGLHDLNLREKFVLIPLVVLTLVMGVVPMKFMNKTDATMKVVQQYVSQETGDHQASLAR